MQTTETIAQTVERCDPADHDWQIVGTCTHGFGGSIFFESARCTKCGQGGHRRTRATACPRRSEKPAEREQRIKRQIEACSVWNDLPAEWRTGLRG